MKEFGEALRMAREELHLTLEEIFEKTRISIKHLKAIEAGDFPSVPQTYVRAFIREYAQLVGLDDDKIVATYNELAARDKGIPKPPEAHDTSNILPHLDETIEIIRPGSVIPRHVEFEGTAEAGVPATTAELSRTPVHVETLPLDVPRPPSPPESSPIAMSPSPPVPDQKNSEAAPPEGAGSSEPGGVHPPNESTVPDSLFPRKNSKRKSGAAIFSRT